MGEGGDEGAYGARQEEVGGRSYPNAVPALVSGMLGRAGCEHKRKSRNRTGITPRGGRKRRSKETYLVRKGGRRDDGENPTVLSECGKKGATISLRGETRINRVSRRKGVKTIEGGGTETPKVKLSQTENAKRTRRNSGETVKKQTPVSSATRRIRRHSQKAWLKTLILRR